MKVYTLKELLKKSGHARKVFKSRVMRELFVTFTSKDAELVVADGASNRQVSEIRTNEVLRMMHEDRWILDEFSLIGPPLAFNQDGQLANGNTRMRALARLGGAMTFRVVVGVPQNLINLMDEVRQRKEVDKVIAFNEEPVIKEITRGVPYRCKQFTQVAKQLYLILVHEKRPTLGDMVQLATYYKDAIMWVLDTHANDRAFKRAAVMGASVLAYQWAKSHNCLERFRTTAIKMIKGENIRGTALILRDYIHALRTHVGARSKVQDCQWAVMMKCLRAYKAILLQAPPLPRLDDVVKGPELRTWFLGCSTTTHVRKIGVGSTREVLRQLRKLQKEVESRKVDASSLLRAVRAMEVAA